MTATASFEHTLASRLSGDLYLPGDEGYALSTPWNVAVQRAPRAVIAAASAVDVVETVRFAAAHGLRVAVQRTGHGAVEIGEDVLLVHTARLDECVLDLPSRTVRVGAGVLWQEVLDVATPHGLAPLVGSSPNVGVVGFLTGGGIGPLVRSYGLSADYIRSFDVVTGDGSLLHVTPERHAELFWGLRGGKGTLGIVTSVEIELVELSSFQGGTLYFDGADAPAVLHAWRAACVDLPDHTSTSVALLQLPPLPAVPAPLAGRMTVAVRVASIAGPAEVDALVAPLLAVATPILGGMGEVPYSAIASLHADPVDPMPTHEASGLLRELSAEAIDALLSVAGPGSGSVQTVVELRLLGGGLRWRTPYRSAFCHREAAANLAVIGVLAPPVATAVPGHAAAVMEAVAPWATGGVLPNFAPSADPDVHARCYDAATRHWLGALAEHHDPQGVLRVGQVIRGR